MIALVAIVLAEQFLPDTASEWLSAVAVSITVVAGITLAARQIHKFMTRWESIPTAQTKLDTIVLEMREIRAVLGQRRTNDDRSVLTRLEDAEDRHQQASEERRIIRAELAAHTEQDQRNFNAIHDEIRGLR